MVADADLQVWLDTQISAGQTVLIPYVQSVKERQVSYRMDLIQRGGAGTSRISQQGKVNAAAAKPTPLARVALGLHREDECQIELMLEEDKKELGTYRFDCPR